MCNVTRLITWFVAGVMVQEAEFIISHKEDFVALDLANDEVKYECRPFAPLFQQAHDAGMHITVHSGEVIMCYQCCVRTPCVQYGVFYLVCCYVSEPLRDR